MRYILQSFILILLCIMETFRVVLRTTKQKTFCYKVYRQKLRGHIMKILQITSNVLLVLRYNFRYFVAVQSNFFKWSHRTLLECQARSKWIWNRLLTFLWSFGLWKWIGYLDIWTCGGDTLNGQERKIRILEMFSYWRT